MAKKKQQHRNGRPLHVWLDADLREAIEAARKRNRRKLRDEVSIALEDYLRQMGLWPLPAPKAGSMPPGE